MKCNIFYSKAANPSQCNLYYVFAQLCILVWVLVFGCLWLCVTRLWCYKLSSHSSLSFCLSPSFSLLPLFIHLVFTSSPLLFLSYTTQWPHAGNSAFFCMREGSLSWEQSSCSQPRSSPHPLVQCQKAREKKEANYSSTVQMVLKIFRNFK